MCIVVPASMSLHHLYAVPEDARRGRQIPWGWHYRGFWKRSQCSSLLRHLSNFKLIFESKFLGKYILLPDILDEFTKATLCISVSKPCREHPGQ